MAVPPQQIDPRSLDDYLAVISKAVFQAGMSWKVVESKWPGTREAFHNFDIQQVVRMNEKDIYDLTGDKRVIRNYRKLAAVVSNARRMLELEEEHGGFRNYLRSKESFDDRLKMIKKDFKYLGPFGTYYFLYVVKEDVPDHQEFERRYKK